MIKERLESIYKVKVLCIFYGGSRSYGLHSPNSDIDLMVIVGDDNPLRHLTIVNVETKDKYECFVLGRSYFKKVQSFEEDTNDFVVAHADNILGLPGSLLYLDETYEEEFNKIINEDWITKLPKFLYRFISFYRLTIKHDAPNYKKHYHVYRIRAMLDNLDLTGFLNLNYAEPYKTIMSIFKEHHNYIPSKQKEISELLDYIENYANRLEDKK